LHSTQNRLIDPSEICTPDFKRKFGRSKKPPGFGDWRRQLVDFPGHGGEAKPDMKREVPWHHRRSGAFRLDQLFICQALMPGSAALG